MFATRNQSVLLGGFLRCILVGAITAVTTVTVFSEPAAAQRFKSLKPKMAQIASRQLKPEVKAALTNSAAFAAGGQQKIDSYFKDYYFRQMTQTSPEALAELSEMREDLFKRFLFTAKVRAAQEYLTSQTLKVMQVIAHDSYHPAVRYNAVLILGMLDQQYASGGANPSPPVVLPAGTNELLELLEQDEFKGVKVHPSVKVGALEGLDRHLRFGLDAQFTERVTKVALAMMSQEPSALGVDADVNNWIKCQAAGLLVRQFAAGPNAEVHAALTKLIADENMSLDDRCCIAGLLEKMKYNAAAGADVASTLVPLGNLTKSVVAEGAEKAQEFEDLILGKNPGGRRVRNIGRGRGQQGPKLERRQLLSCLTMIADGANSLSKGLPDAEQQKVASLIGLLIPVKKISEDKNSLDLDVAGEVIKLEDSLDNLIASWQPASVDEDAVDADFGE